MRVYLLLASVRQNDCFRSESHLCFRMLYNLEWTFKFAFFVAILSCRSICSVCNRLVLLVIEHNRNFFAHSSRYYVSVVHELYRNDLVSWEENALSQYVMDELEQVVSRIVKNHPNCR